MGSRAVLPAQMDLSPCFRISPLAIQLDSKTHARVPVIRLDPQTLGVMRDGLVRLALSGQSKRIVKVRVGIVGFELDRFGEMADGLIEPTGQR